MMPSSYSDRNLLRQQLIEESTMNFIQYFIDLGDDRATANLKVSELSTEVAQYIYIYILGNTQPLINSINSSSLSFMDSNAKLKIVGDLTNF